MAAAGIFCLLLAQLLWRVHIVLPAGLLPDGSIFQISHYIEWWNAALHIYGALIYCFNLPCQMGKEKNVAGQVTLFSC